MITLRDLRQDDLESVVRWRNDPDVCLHLSNRLKTIDQATAWLAHLRSVDGIWLKAVENDGKLIGYAAVESIDTSNRKCELILIIGEKENWGKGIGAFVLKEMLNYAFKTLNMHRVWAVVSRGNDRSERLIKSAGLINEGVMREAVIINGEYTDLLLYSILENEYSG
ncbi:MAG: GNAT family protein [Candidatus Zixiibacteriota bacterium]